MLFTHKEQLRELLKKSPDKFTDCDVDRFLRYIDDSVGPHGCWSWLAGDDGKGYGNFWFRSKTKSAHRLVCIAINPDMDLTLCSLHRCDNRNCVNPNHLRPGTHFDNMQDCAQRGGHPFSKLTPADVRSIRIWKLMHYSNREVAKAYSVTPSAIARINSGSRWSHVINEAPSFRHRSGRAASNYHEGALLSCA